MSNILPIAINTFREAVRNRVLYVLLFFSVLILLGAWVASTLSIEAPERIVRDLGVGAINIISGLIAVFVGIGLVYNDLDKKTIYTIVSKPISRWHFIAGKYLGLLLTIFVNVLVMTWVFCTVLHLRNAFSADAMTEHLMQRGADGVLQSKGALAGMWYYASQLLLAIAKGFLNIASLGFYSTDITSGLFAASLMTMLEMSIITAFAVLFSSFSSPTLSAFMTAIVWVIGKGNQDLYLLTLNLLRKTGGDFEALTQGEKIVYYFAQAASHLAPNLEVFNPRGAVAAFQPVVIDVYTVVYGVAYAVGVVALASMIFQRRNFK